MEPSHLELQCLNCQYDIFGRNICRNLADVNLCFLVIKGLVANATEAVKNPRCGQDDF